MDNELVNINNKLIKIETELSEIKKTNKTISEILSNITTIEKNNAVQNRELIFISHKVEEIQKQLDDYKKMEGDFIYMSKTIENFRKWLFAIGTATSIMVFKYVLHIIDKS